MPKTNIKVSHKADVKVKTSTLTNSAFELVNWPVSPCTSHSVNEKTLALQTTRISPELNTHRKTDRLIDHLVTKSQPSFDSFNLGLHVGDNAQQVIANRNELTQFINQSLATRTAQEAECHFEKVNIQWLDQVHGSHVAEVTTVNRQAMVADASVTRQKGIALAIMTADCLPILLSHKEGAEIAAIHGGWRPLAANIIGKTLSKMQSEPADIVAWLGPCIGKDAFEVGSDVKEAFTQQSKNFSCAFARQPDGKFLADLHKIAELQLKALGITAISSLVACTYQKTDKYYSYRKDQVTGRMATIICRL